VVLVDILSLTTKSNRSRSSRKERNLLSRVDFNVQLSFDLHRGVSSPHIRGHFHRSPAERHVLTESGCHSSIHRPTDRPTDGEAFVIFVEVLSPPVLSVAVNKSYMRACRGKNSVTKTTVRWLGTPAGALAGRDGVPYCADIVS